MGNHQDVFHPSRSWSQPCLFWAWVCPLLAIHHGLQLYTLSPSCPGWRVLWLRLALSGHVDAPLTIRLQKAPGAFFGLLGAAAALPAGPCKAQGFHKWIHNRARGSTSRLWDPSKLFEFFPSSFPAKVLVSETEHKVFPTPTSHTETIIYISSLSFPSSRSNAEHSYHFHA